MNSREEFVEEVEKVEVNYTEEFHLEGVSEEIKTTYFKHKEKLLKINRNLVFNPQKFHISVVHDRNIAYFKFRKKKIRLVITLSEKGVKIKIKNIL